MPPQVAELAFWSALKEGGRFNTQGLSQPRHDLDRGISDAAFNAADIGAVEVGTESKFLLRDALALPFSPQIFPDDQPDIHAGGEGWRSL